jgi:hypothetical protein
MDLNVIASSQSLAASGGLRKTNENFVESDQVMKMRMICSVNI